MRIRCGGFIGVVALVVATAWPVRVVAGDTGDHASRAPATDVAAWQAFAGEWRPAPDAAEAVKRAVARATARMFPLVRSIARGRLFARCRPPARLRMGLHDDAFVIEFSGSPPQELPLSGATVTSAGRALSVRLEGGEMRHSGATEEGTRLNVFRLEHAGSVLVMRTTVRSPRLPAPVEFEVRFNRAGR